MQRIMILFSVGLLFFGFTASAASNTFLDYQNYNHGYCPDCQCTPCTCKGGEGKCQSCQGKACSSCNGQGSCPNCQGKGSCPACHAKKGRSCSTCQGSGTCTSCKGEGTCQSCAARKEAPPAAPCDPCAPVCGAEKGPPWAAFGVAAVAVVVAVFLILTAGSGSRAVHS